jgi:DNA-directed RNA polymerase specialized sigma24 family protein
MRQFSINDLYSQFINGAVGRNDFEGFIYQNLAGNQSKVVSGRWTQEEYEDFISWIYPRIHNAIDTYKETGASFEVYMATIIRRAAKEYRIRKTTRNVIEYAAWTAQIHEQYTNEETPFYLQDLTEKTIIKSSPHAAVSVKQIKNPRQLLILILKCYRYITDDFIDRIAPIIGIDRDELTEMINKIRAIRAERDNEIYLMRERIYSQFYRCIVYEKRLSYLQENSPAAMEMKQHLERALKRLDKMRNRQTRIRTDPSNRQVAQVIGISKGSVDSGLYALKAKWKLSMTNPY